MARRLPGLAATLVLTAALAACSDDADPPPAPSTASASTSDEAEARATHLPEGDLPAALRLRDVDGRTITAEPFADFAVASGTGVWVSGVAPGLVRYDDTTGSITARTRIRGAVTQALEESRGEVFVPTTLPRALYRVDSTTGEVRARVKLPASPLAESAVGASGNRVYVLVDPIEPTVVVIEDSEIVDSIAVHEAATAVRAAYGSLWVPTGDDTVERLDLATGEWSSIAAGPSPRFLDVGYGAVWVMNQGDGSITRIDGRTGESEAIAVTGGFIGGGDLTTGAGAVWLRTDSAVARIDPADNTVTHVIELPPGSGSVAATDDALWITNHDHLAVHRVPLPLPD